LRPSVRCAGAAAERKRGRAGEREGERKRAAAAAASAPSPVFRPSLPPPPLISVTMHHLAIEHDQELSKGLGAARSMSAGLRGRARRGRGSLSGFSAIVQPPAFGREAAA
jgi:hypothetical protein